MNIGITQMIHTLLVLLIALFLLTFIVSVFIGTFIRTEKKLPANEGISSDDLKEKLNLSDNQENSSKDLVCEENIVVLAEEQIDEISDDTIKIASGNEEKPEPQANIIQVEKVEESKSPNKKRRRKKPIQ